ncbi:bifunctional PIG-L family deacetylase/class I SAM-dependent methyltransferase [Neolewinella antarctica]|uniref:LmbE family N-acetylglucosaminyl deacetylase/SAM-dependent methyltransferase n=1 Tax=Neolewinella antarctica TaxID=442734 RepID=A0ABX0XD57_9BACT|nr:bifunctional PIG-L family deacetylase/class I SAM-dependent methyltransferase [Neolewinella antarctica]NJC26854.1 LmbE family N-acetylglucosaminyl deacetylase/SAM-dependent methyltransferase [Neolewinella antarctica]
MTISTSSELTKRKRALASEPPLHPHSDLHFWKSTLLFAPHPDDESLGCGGLVALLRERDQHVHVVFVSDGAMSHPNSRRYDRAARVSLRESEALAACQELGVDEANVSFLRYPDTEVPRQHSPGFDGAVDHIRQLIDRQKPSHVLVPWRRDPHCDHRGTWEICREAVSQLAEKPRWVEYPIWMWNSSQEAELPYPDEVIAWRLDITEQQPHKQRAIAHHVSQTTRLIDDDADGFMLSPEMLANFRHDTELYFEDAEKQHRSLSEAYFNQVYDNNNDPWSFETSQYEQDKYRHTVAALPKQRYANGLEIGCSIGILTSMLADRCDHLLALDTSAKPLARARARLGENGSVVFRQMDFPHERPEELFDLIILSEVGYYWSQEDLGVAVAAITKQLRPGGDLMLVHYTPYVPDYPLTGDEVHEAFATKLRRNYAHLHEDRRQRYRMDVYRKPGGASNA